VFIRRRQGGDESRRTVAKGWRPSRMPVSDARHRVRTCATTPRPPIRTRPPRRCLAHACALSPAVHERQSNCWSVWTRPQPALGYSHPPAVYRAWLGVRRRRLYKAAASDVGIARLQSAQVRGTSKAASYGRMQASRRRATGGCKRRGGAGCEAPPCIRSMRVSPKASRRWQTTLPVTSHRLQAVRGVLPGPTRGG
jgi:hypothetical protein